MNAPLTTVGRERPLVLVVDDDATMRLLMTECLAQAGFDLLQADNGEYGIEQFVTMRPDLVLLDVQLPDIDGFAVCSRLAALPGSANVPIVMVTGLDDLKSINRAYEAGATDFITKPINWTILAHRVRYLLRASDAFRALHVSATHNRALLSVLPDMILRLRKDGHCIGWEAGNNAAASHQPQQYAGRNIRDVMPGSLAETAMHHIQRTLSTSELQSFEYRLPNDQEHHWEARMVARDEDEVIVVIRDITEHKLALERIHYLAYYDSLTGLLNRQSFGERLQDAISRASRSDTLIGVLFLDLDRFKRINDTLGHAVGDMALRTMAERLSLCLRDYDIIARDTGEKVERHVARLGGDEFTVLLADVAQAEDAAIVARRILDVAGESMSIEGHDIVITPSIGIALYPLDGEDAGTLLKHADRAMYHAKEQGKNNYQFYSHSMNTRAYERLSLENRLRKALDRGELLLHYQPQVDSLSGRIIGAEALLRWQDDELGLILPAEIIPLAEETGLIVPIGRWMLRSACAYNKALQNAGLPPIRVSINLSARQFKQPGLVDMIAGILQETGLPPRYLDLEITEDTIMHLGDETMTTLHQLKALGVSLALDDFGTGYSSLSYLKLFPVDTLKIDRSFIDSVTTDSGDASITMAIIGMGRSLKMDVIAEGVETREQLKFLQAQGCHVIQGFLFSRPLPAEAFMTVLAREPMPVC